MKHLSIHEVTYASGGTDVTASRFIPKWHSSYFALPVLEPQLPLPPMVPPIMTAQPPTPTNITPPPTPAPIPILMLPLILPLPPTP
jgi:hypothetical protein